VATAMGVALAWRRLLVLLLLLLAGLSVSYWSIIVSYWSIIVSMSYVSASQPARDGAEGATRSHIKELS